MYDGRCTNCHEELFILDQYVEQGMELPADDTEFMKKVREQSATIDQHQIEKEAHERNLKRWPNHYKNEWKLLH